MCEKLADIDFLTPERLEDRLFERVCVREWSEVSDFHVADSESETYNVMLRERLTEVLQVGTVESLLEIELE